MNKKVRIHLFSWFGILLILCIPVLTARASTQGEMDDPQDGSANKGFSDLDSPVLSADGNTLFNAVPPRVLVVDPNPEMQGLRFPLEPGLAASVADTRSTRATFSITYLSSGSTQFYYNCINFPTEARTAFDAAAAIWANTVQSAVPITISACWSNNLPYGVLGGSGGQPLHRDFPGAPQANTWYQGSLANSLNGNDLDVGFDMKIIYSSNFSWYFGTDGLTPSGQYDLVTVAAHEIAHGLNFSGSAGYSGGLGEYKIGGYPVIYDTFMEDIQQNPLLSYPNPSTALGSLFTSNNLWWDGTNANAANGGARVKMYAPSSWAQGSSYSHLDYNTYAGTSNSLMVYAIGAGSSQHNPGEVTKGLFKDMGWMLDALPPGNFNKINPVNGATDQLKNLTLNWGTSSGATGYEYCYDTTNDNTCTTWVSTGINTSAALSGLNGSTTYYWQVRANKGGGTTYADGSPTAFWSFTTFTDPPGYFNKTSPANGATVYSASPKLQWDTSNEATSYEYCYDTINDDACTTWVSAGTARSKQLSGLNPDTTYYWHVRAKNSVGTTYANSSATAFWRFTTWDWVNGAQTYIPLFINK